MGGSPGWGAVTGGEGPSGTRVVLNGWPKGGRGAPLRWGWHLVEEGGRVWGAPSVVGGI